MNLDIAKCTSCGKEFKKKKNLSRHLKEVHKKNAVGKLSSVSEEEKLLCVLCDKTFTRKSSLQRHITGIHLNTSDIFKCTICNYSSKYKLNLKRHIQKWHTNSGFEGITEKNFKCSKCSANFKYKYSVRRHERKVHNIRKPYKLINGRKCPLCSYNTSDPHFNSMYIHFENTHNIDLKWETYSFTSLLEFYDWKNHIEKQTLSSYIKSSKSKNTTTFQCHRCGIYRPTGKNKRRTKTAGTCKINSYCPGSIKIKVQNDCVIVVYQSVHVGHKHELKHIRLSKEERRFLASKLVGKVPPEEELTTYSENLTNSDLQISGFHELNCSCMDNATQNNMCEHVQLVAHQIMKEGIKFEEILRPANSEDGAQVHEIVLRQVSHEDFSKDLEEKKQMLFCEVSKLEQYLKYNCTTTEQIDFMMKTIKQSIITIEAMKSSDSFQSTVSPNQPGNTNIVKQRHFFTPLKNKSKNKNVCKEEMPKIALKTLLMENQDSSLHNQTNQMEPGTSREYSDHTYGKPSVGGATD